MLFDLSNKTVVITGATGGIGLAIAQTLRASGAHLVLTVIQEDERCTEIVKDLGGSDVAKIIACDLSNMDLVEQLPQRILSLVPKVDCLVCNAGITRDALGLRMGRDDFEEVIKVNLEANFILNREFLKHMVRNKTGRIVNIASVVAFSGNAGQVNYSASKAGLVAMSKSFAREVATRGITVNCIAPGFIKTAMTDKLSEEQKEKLISAIPANRFGNASDVAHAALYLLSDEAGYMTGQTLHINGGMVMC